MLLSSLAEDAVVLRYQKKGLIFTNHHCGYGAIQKLSAVEHDYLKDGFAANKVLMNCMQTALPFRSSGR